LSFVPTIYDNHGRPITYLRLSVTDRCNLRCFYCMPEQGINYLPKHHLLSYEELLAASQVFADLGINKIRITGGEPFVRKDLIFFLEKLSTIPGIQKIAITSNGVLLNEYLTQLKALGISEINLSIDSLDPKRFQRITRRNEFNKVWNCYESLLEHDFKVKLNCVVIDGQNIEDIVPFVELTRQHPVEVRFIEEMPFNGQGAHYPVLRWNHKKIYEHIAKHFHKIEQITAKAGATADRYQVSGHKGKFGIIAAFSRTFCRTCNRIRLSANGDLRTCLYGQPKMNVRDELRGGTGIDELRNNLIESFQTRAKNGFEAEQQEVKESMSLIGG